MSWYLSLYSILFIIFSTSTSIAQDESSYRFSYENLNSGYIRFYLKEYNKKYKKSISYEKAYNDILTLAKKASAVSYSGEKLVIEKFKTEIENILAVRHKNNEYEIEGNKHFGIVYNKQYNNFFEYLYEGKMQCDSGTQLILIAHRIISRNKEKYQKNNPVVIYSNGHVLYGEITKDEHLIGHETTVDGPLTSKLGKLSNLSKNSDISLPIEVDFYLATYSAKWLEKSRLRNIAYQRLEKIYGVNVKLLRKRVRRKRIQGLLKALSKPANWGIKKIIWGIKAANRNIFGFGYSNVKDGNQIREKLGWDLSLAEQDKMQMFNDINSYEEVDKRIYHESHFNQRDAEGNSPLLYALKYGSGERFITEVKDQYTNFLYYAYRGKSWDRYYNDYRDSFKKNICSQINELGENILLAFLKNERLSDFPLDHYKFSCNEPWFFLQQDYEGFNALHLIAQKLSLSVDGWKHADYGNILNLAKWIFSESSKLITRGDEVAGRGLLLAKNIYNQTPMDLLLDLIIYEI